MVKKPIYGIFVHTVAYYSRFEYCFSLRLRPVASRFRNHLIGETNISGVLRYRKVSTPKLFNAQQETRHVKDMGDLLQQCIRVSKQSGLGLYFLDRGLCDSGGETPWGSAHEPNASDK
jgi:hypothetical protein